MIMKKNTVGSIAVGFLVAIIVLRVVWTAGVATDQPSSVEMANTLTAIIASLISFAVIFVLCLKFGKNMKFLSNKIISIVLFVIGLVLLFL
jgi:mannose/fructose/N-acetylgalactosamine-specific phosphotransferase system component IID